MITSHQPVLVDEVISYLITIRDGVYVDGTVGTGGHSFEICKRLGPAGSLICLDVDRASIRLAQERLSVCGDRVKVVRESYVDLDRVLGQTGIGKANGILLDLGLSSYQLESSGRGFSFSRDEPLDMRMDQDRGVTAGELINSSSAKRLQQLLWRYAQERWARLIAQAIARRRQEEPIRTSGQLARLIETTIPRRHHPRNIHPATKTFQALRIAVNRELQNIAEFLQKAPFLLVTGGRLVVISYHSLEDRLVKQAFQQARREREYPRKLPTAPDPRPQLMKPLIRKGLRPTQAEVNSNPRCRSAIMRVGERI